MGSLTQSWVCRSWAGPSWCPPTDPTFGTLPYRHLTTAATAAQIYCLAVKQAATLTTIIQVDFLEMEDRTPTMGFTLLLEMPISSNVMLFRCSPVWKRPVHNRATTTFLYLLQDKLPTSLLSNQTSGRQRRFLSFRCGQDHPNRACERVFVNM